jgi:hypothetical protein
MIGVEKKRENRRLPMLFVSDRPLPVGMEVTRYLAISIPVRGGMALSWIRVASDFSDFSCRDTGRVGMSLELGRLFHLWDRRPVVSLGVCMVTDLQLI